VVPDRKKANGQKTKGGDTGMRPIILLLVVLAAAVLVFPVGHATTSTCTGTTSNAFTPTGLPTNVVTQTVGKFTITTENFGLCFTGAFNGTTQGTVTIIVNTSTGNGIFYGQNNFTGTVTNSSGSSTGTILAPFAASFTNGNFQGDFTLYGGTGGLKGLSGFGTIKGLLATFVGTYTATFFTGK
jgi:hypothetical protein